MSLNDSIHGIPTENLVELILIDYDPDTDQYQLALKEITGRIPLPRRSLATLLRRFADLVDSEADESEAQNRS
jgi:hypothetical protein